MKAGILVSIALPLLLAIGCGDDDATPAAGGSTDGPDYDFSAVKAEMESVLAESTNATGASIIIVHRDHGVVYKEAFGDHDLDTIALIASASKLISAGMLMTQFDDGKLDLDEPISTYIEECEDKPGITAAHLVSNTSGLPGLLDTILNLFSSGSLLCQFDTNGTLEKCTRDICGADLGDALQPAGSGVRYGGAQWTVAGGLTEILSGKSWNELLTERFIEPCGLETLRYGNHYMRAALEGNALGYPGFFQHDPSTIPETDNPQIEGGVMCDLDDYAKILLMHLRGGMCDDNRVLSEEAVELMRVDRLAGMPPGDLMGMPIEAYGFGWWIDPANEVYYDPGLYGAFPWIDLERGYGAYISIETNALEGMAAWKRIRPLVEAAFDAVEPEEDG